ALEKRLREEQPQWEESLSQGQLGSQRGEVQWRSIAPDEIFSEGGAILTKTADGAIVASGLSPETDEYTITAKTNYVPTAFKLVTEPNETLANKGPGRADNGNFVLTELTLSGDTRGVELALVKSDFEQEGWPAAGAFDGNQKTGWAVQPKFGEPHTL